MGDGFTLHDAQHMISAQHVESRLEFAPRVRVARRGGDLDPLAVKRSGFIGAAELFQRLAAMKISG